MIKIDHFYIKVNNLNKAIEFYEKLLSIKVKNKEDDRWADFDNGNIYFGILNSEIDNEDVIYGDNITLALKTDDIESEYKRVSSLNPKTITEIFIVDQPAEYKYFQFTDPWNNLWEVAQYNY